MYSTELFGPPSSPGQFRSAYAKAFSLFMSGPEVGETARLHNCYSRGDLETVLIEIEVVLPQYPVTDIHSREVIACVFGTQDKTAPNAYAMRLDFPRLPHQNIVAAGSPRMLCLDATTWSESKYRWSSSGFLEAIRSWLARAATGELHAPGQPREPLLMNPDGYLIIPSKIDLDHLERLEISGDISVSPAFVWARSMNDSKPGKGRFKAICFHLPSREHGIIESRPDTLADLEILCAKGDYDLLTEISQRFKDGLITNGATESGLQLDLLLVLHWDVTGNESPEVLSHEEWAFVIKDAASVGEALGVLTRAQGMIALAVPSQPRDSAKLTTIKVSSLAILKSLDETSALAASGLTKKYPAAAVLGVGALGSRCVEILARQGFSKGVLIDHDRLFPHNTGRHALLGCSVGWPKAPQMATFLNGMHDFVEETNEVGFTSVAESFAMPPSGNVESALRAADCVFDFSASVAVSRGLSSLDGINRCISAFLTPGADTLFIHVEDGERNIRLDWLEAIALRAIVEDGRLNGAYLNEGSKIWFGGPCREVSTVLPNENVALFAAVWAGFVTRHHASGDAHCVAYTMNPDTMELSMVGLSVSKPIVKVVNGWTVKYDETLIAHLKVLRAERLPNETGGVLLGIIDREAKTCCVVIGSGSPPDSEEWPQSYVRGVVGLKSFVDDVAARTAGQLQYIGEWHSHPSGASSTPSQTDLIALDKLKATMVREGLPAVAFVIGEEAEPFILVGWSNE
jgi:hypothetical protein